MKLGAYTACLHDKPLEEALAILRDLGLNSAEINAGGFIGTPHIPVDELLDERRGPRGRTSRSSPKYGIELTALNCNGNPLHPDPEVHARRRPQAHDQAGRPARDQDGDHDVRSARPPRRAARVRPGP